MNPIENNILPTYLGNYGPFYANNDNIPNPWIMIPNPYYLGNPPLTFSNTHGHVAYPFLNTVSAGITTTKGSHGVQACMMTPLITTFTNGFSTKNLVPYFQPPTQNLPSLFSTYGGGIPTRGNASPLHGSERPPRGGNKPLGGGGGPPSRGEPQVEVDPQVAKEL
jgi:hypothetical protein